MLFPFFIYASIVCFDIVAFVLMPFPSVHNNMLCTGLEIVYCPSLFLCTKNRYNCTQLFDAAIC